MKNIYYKLPVQFLLLCVILLFNAMTGLAQQQEFVLQKWAGSSGTQNFFYKNITKKDASNNTYTAGATLNSSGNYDLLLVKYNSSGTVSWTKQYNGAGGGHDMATGVHIDGSGNVYVTGTTYVSATNLNDIITIKYNSSGTQQWLKTYNGSGSSYDAGGAIVVNAAGNNVFICGGAMTTSTLGDFVTINYNAANGTQNWVSTYNYNGNYDVAAKIQLTGLNGTSVQVSGGVQHSSTVWKYAIVSYSGSNGAMIGSPSISGNNTGTIDELGDICEDASQTYTYVAGSVNNTATGTGYDYKIAKLLNSNLSIVWERTWNGADNLDDKAADIIIDASGNVYVTGYTSTSLQDKNYATVKYNSSGMLQWTKYHNGAGNKRDEATAIAIDAANNVYVTGTSNTGSSQDYYTIKYKPDNTVVWEKNYNGLDNGLDKAYDVVVDPITKDVLVSGQTQTATGYSYTMVNTGQATTVFPATDEALSSSFCYTENLGQVLKTDGTSADNLVLFSSLSSSPSIYFTGSYFFSYVLSSIDTIAATNDTLHRVDIGFVNPKTPKFYGLSKRSDYYNFYLGHIPEGRAHVTNYSRLVSPELYANIDAIYGSNSAGYTMRFVCKPGSNPANVKLTFTGSDSVRIINNDLIIYTKLGQIKHPRLTAKLINNSGVETALGWLPSYVRNGNEISFSYGSYDTGKNLVLQMGIGTASTTGGGSDNLEWSTYLGGNNTDTGYDISVDPEEKVYVVGATVSNNFPNNSGTVTDVAQANFGGYQDAFITTFDNESKLLWTTYYGGSISSSPTDENAADIALGVLDDATGRILVTGFTWCTDFTTLANGNSYHQDNIGGERDAFILQLNPNGSRNWATYFGGNTQDIAHSIQKGSDGSFYISGSVSSEVHISPYTDVITSESCNSPTNNGFPLCNNNGISYYKNSHSGPFNVNGQQDDYDAYVAKFNPSRELIWSSFFGGSGSESAWDVAINAIDNSINITGYTSSNVVGNNSQTSPCSAPTDAGFPLCDLGSNSYFQDTYPGTDFNSKNAYVAQFDSDNKLRWSTYFGSADINYGNHLAFNSTGDLYLVGAVGTSTSDDTPDIYCAAPTNHGFPLCDPGGSAYYRNNNNVNVSYDIYISRFSNSRELTWSTFYGGTGNEFTGSIFSENGTADITIDADDRAYILFNTIKISGTDGDVDTYEITDFYNQSINDGTGSTRDAFIASFDKFNVPLWATYYGGSGTTVNGSDIGCGIKVTQNKLYVTGTTISSNFPYRCPSGAPDPWCEDQLVLTDPRTYDAFVGRFNLTDLPIISGIETNNLLESLFSIYPNPTNSNVTLAFDLPYKQKIIIKVYNTLGELLYLQEVNGTPGKFTHIVGLENYSEGIYIIQVIAGNQAFSNKVIKQQ